MEHSLKAGERFEITHKVTNEDTATAIGSGGVSVYGTPYMIALIESACLKLADEKLPPEYSTVGTMVNITHFSPTPVGMYVTAKAELMGVDGKTLTYKVTCEDEKGLIGEGIHERVIIEKERFLEKANNKLILES